MDYIGRMEDWFWLKALLLPVFAFVLWEVIAKRLAASLTNLWGRIRAKQPGVRRPE